MSMKLLNTMFLLILMTCLSLPAAAGTDTVTVFAAASTTNAVTDIAGLYQKHHPETVRLSFASSSTLAKQIERGAPADIYISANPKWMDYLEEKGAIVKESRRDLLGNRLVLVAPADSGLENLTIDPGLDLAGLLKEGRLSMGDPDHVPAGIYGKQALTRLNLWESVRDKIARAKDVRAALVLVEREECPLGEVYATDAAISTKVKVAGIFPQDSHPPIVYPAARITRTGEAESFMAFLASDRAAAVFKKYGFSVH